MELLEKKTTLYLERNEEKRQKYIEELKIIDPDDIVYIDESGIDDSLCREYARSKRGSKVISEIKGKRSERTSIISGWLHKLKKYIAPFVFNGYTNSLTFNCWFENCLLSELRPGMCIVMDNASFHKSKKTRDLIESAGCKLLYLPPYSPDLNPIENQWAVTKSSYKTFRQRGYEHHNAIDAAFLEC